MSSPSGAISRCSRLASQQEIDEALHVPLAGRAPHGALLGSQPMTSPSPHEVRDADRPAPGHPKGASRGAHAHEQPPHFFKSLNAWFQLPPRMAESTQTMHMASR